MISFIIGIITIITGLAFTLITTRSLSLDEFGTWSLIGGLTTYVYILRPTISYWSTREIARGNETGKTAILSTGLMATLGVFIYLLIASFFGLQTGVNLTILLFAGILIPTEFFKNALSSITLGYKPQNESYGLLIFELVKIPIALLLIYFLELGLEGVIITVFMSNLFSIGLLTYRTKEKIKGKFQIKYLKKWLKIFWLPMYPDISKIINVSDVAVVTLITGSVAGLAYWSSSKAVSHIVQQSSKIGKAVYPKLLGGGKKEHFQENLVLILYFALPLSMMSIVFSKSTLFILNPIYSDAFFVVIFQVPTIFLQMMSDLLRQALTGIEKIDTNEKATFKDYIKSKLFFLPTLKNIQRGIYLTSLIVMLLLVAPNVDSDIDIIVYWALIALLTQIPFTAYLFALVKREFSPSVDRLAIIKYFIISILVTIGIFFLMEEYLVYNESIFEFLPQFALYVLLFIISYLGITYMIDWRTRKIFKGIIKELVKK